MAEEEIPAMKGKKKGKKGGKKKGGGKKKDLFPPPPPPDTLGLALLCLDMGASPDLTDGAGAKPPLWVHCVFSKALKVSCKPSELRHFAYDLARSEGAELSKIERAEEKEAKKEEAGQKSKKPDKSKRVDS